MDNYQDNNVLDLDKTIPNYTQIIKNTANDYSNKAKNVFSEVNKIGSETIVDMDKELGGMGQIAGQFLSNKWNEFRETFNQWSIGNEAPVPKIIGGKKTRKNKRKRTKNKVNKRKSRK